jgi:hypothetical protein
LARAEDRVAFGLGDAGQNADSQAAWFRHVGSDELDARVARRLNKNALRLTRSSLARTSVAQVTLAWCSALANSGRSERAPVGRAGLDLDVFLMAAGRDNSSNRAYSGAVTRVPRDFSTAKWKLCAPWRMRPGRDASAHREALIL